MYEENVFEEEVGVVDFTDLKNPCKNCGEEMDEKVTSPLCVDCEMSLEED